MSSVQTAEAVTPRYSWRNTVVASVVAMLVWATFVAAAMGCWLLRRSSGSHEILTYGIGFAVGSGIAGIVVLTLGGRFRWALAAVVPFAIISALAFGCLWTIPGVSRTGVFSDPRDIRGSLVVGSASGITSGLAVGCAAAILVYLAVQSKAWGLAVVMVLLVIAATRWPLGHVVEYTTALGFELRTPGRYSNQTVWYSAESIIGAAEGGVLGSFVGAIVGGFVAAIGKQRIKSNR